MGLDQVGERLGGDERHVAVEDEHRLVAQVRRRGLHGAAGPVGLGLDRQLDAVGQVALERALGPSTTTTLPAPAASAAATGQAIIGRPQRSCRTLGVRERMRVPWPAARMTTVGAVTARMLEAVRRHAGPRGRSRSQQFRPRGAAVPSHLFRPRGVLSVPAAAAAPSPGAVEVRRCSTGASR